MTVSALDHVNIRTADPPATIAFFRDVLGMGVQPAPGQPDQSRGAWILDASGKPVIHIGDPAMPYPSDAAFPWKPAQGGGALHHVALACADLPGMMAALTSHGVAFSSFAYPQARLTQLLLTDPNGIILELNFHET